MSQQGVVETISILHKIQRKIEVYVSTHNIVCMEDLNNIKTSKNDFIINAYLADCNH